MLNPSEVVVYLHSAPLVHTRGEILAAEILYVSRVAVYILGRLFFLAGLSYGRYQFNGGLR
jgi:hypothetical protein